VARLYPTQPIVGVGAVVISSDRILLIKRKNEPGKGKWSIPGGKVELGEKAEQATIRETKEETNLTVSSPQLIDVVNSIEFDELGKVRYHFVIIDYLVRVTGGASSASSDAAELRWVNFEDVESYDLTSTFREFFRRNSQKIRESGRHEDHPTLTS